MWKNVVNFCVILPRSTASFIACRMVAMLNAGLNLESCMRGEEKKKQMQKYINECECRPNYRIIVIELLIEMSMPNCQHIYSSNGH